MWFYEKRDPATNVLISANSAAFDYSLVQAHHKIVLAFFLVLKISSYR